MYLYNDEEFVKIDDVIEYHQECVNDDNIDESLITPVCKVVGWLTVENGKSVFTEEMVKMNGITVGHPGVLAYPCKCSLYMLKSWTYCPDCGAKLDWSEVEK